MCDKPRRIPSVKIFRIPRLDFFFYIRHCWEPSLTNIYNKILKYITLEIKSKSSVDILPDVKIRSNDYIVVR
jgi:hypothetical protein